MVAPDCTLNELRGHVAGVVGTGRTFDLSFNKRVIVKRRRRRRLPAGSSLPLSLSSSQLPEPRTSTLHQQGCPLPRHFV